MQSSKSDQETNSSKHQRKEASYLKNFVYTHKNPYHDKLKSFDGFVLRDEEGEKHLSKWASNVFKNEQELHVEIGSGYGQFMLQYCQDHPTTNFIGMDHRFKRSYTLAKKLDKIKNKNFRYLRAKGERLEFLFGESEVDTIYYFFPDPWPKKRHLKNRLFQTPFIEAAYKVLKPGGKIMIKTDHDGYAEWMSKFIGEQDLFTCRMKTTDLRSEFPEHFLAKYTTKFEKIFLKQNINIKAFELESKK